MSNPDLTLVFTDGNQRMFIQLISKPENQTWLEREKPLRKHCMCENLSYNETESSRWLQASGSGACWCRRMEVHVFRHWVWLHGERILAALCLLMDAIGTVWDGERGEQDVWWQRGGECLLRPGWLMHDDRLWVKGEGPAPNQQSSRH